MILKSIFWISLLFILYTYLGYPLLLYIQRLFKKKDVAKRYILPRVSIIIAVFNEELYIKRKLENILDIDYPSDRMEVIVVSDGSTDSTDAIVSSFQERNQTVSLHKLPNRRGKAAALNQGVSRAKGEILVFTDTRQLFETNAVRELVSNLSDPAVGAVSGELFLTPRNNGNIKDPINFYWSYEKWIRKYESSTASVIGVTGAIYALKKELYSPMPEQTILDDVFIPMKVVLKGYRVVFDDHAVAYDDAQVDSQTELRRKIRTLTGNYQILSLIPELFSFKHMEVCFYYFSHKITRLLAPFVFIMLFVSNLFLVEGGYSFTLYVQCTCYGLALLAPLLNFKKRELQFLYLPYTFLILNYAAVKGLLNFLKNKSDVWHKN